MGRSLTPPIGFESGLAGVNIRFSSLMREQEERNPQVVTEHCPGGIEKLKAKKKKGRTFKRDHRQGWIHVRLGPGVLLL